MAGVVSSQLSLQTSLVVSHQKLISPTFKLNFFILTTEKRALLRCNMAKKKISLADQILDYIEGSYFAYVSSRIKYITVSIYCSRDFIFFYEYIITWKFKDFAGCFVIVFIPELSLCV